MVKGGYKNCTVYFYTIYDVNQDSNFKTKIDSYIYDKRGNLVERIEYPGDNDSINYFYSYDDKDNMIRYEWLELREKSYHNKFWIHKYSFKYNDSNDIIEYLVFNLLDGTNYTKYFPVYNEKTKEKSWESINADVTVYLLATFKYDENGNKIEELWYNKDGSYNEKHSLKYDQKGNLIEIEYLFPIGVTIYKINYNYDQKGKKIEEIIEDNSEWDNHSLYKITYKYDKFRNIIEKSFSGVNSKEFYRKDEYIYSK